MLRLVFDRERYSGSRLRSVSELCYSDRRLDYLETEGYVEGFICWRYGEDKFGSYGFSGREGS